MRPEGFPRYSVYSDPLITSIVHVFGEITDPEALINSEIAGNFENFENVIDFGCGEAREHYGFSEISRFAPAIRDR